jgi:hypothetical protein
MMARDPDDRRRRLARRDLPDGTSRREVTAAEFQDRDS